MRMNSDGRAGASMKKIFLLTADQVRRLRGADQERIEKLADRQAAALRQATRLADQGASGPAYVTYREAQERHLAEAARDRAQPLAVRLGDEATLTREPRQDSSSSARDIATLVAAERPRRGSKRKAPTRAKRADPKRKRSESAPPPPPPPPPSPPKPKIVPWLRLGQSRLRRRT